MREMKQTTAVGAMLVVFGLAASGIVGCAGGPRSKPIPTTEIDKGTGTLQGARKFLEGRWARPRSKYSRPMLKRSRFLVPAS